MNTISEHENDYISQAYKRWTLAELGQWVALLHARSFHRSNPEKAAKDRQDARNYWLMMGEVLDEAEKR